MRNVYCFILSCVISILLLSSCSSKKENEELSGIKLIPNNAFAVIELDLKNAVSLLKDSQGGDILKRLEQNIDRIPIPGIRNKAKDILNNPQNLGIKLGEPIYLSAKLSENSVNNGLCTYISGSLANVRNFESVIRILSGEKPLKFDDINYFDVGKAYVFYTPSAFLIAEKDDSESLDSLQKRIKAIFNQKEYFSGTKLYALMAVQQGMVKAGFDFAPIFNNEPIVEDFKSHYPIFAGDIDVIRNSVMAMTLNGREGDVSLKYIIKNDSPKFNSEYQKLLSVFGQIKGDHLKYINNDELFMALININGQKLDEFISPKLEGIDLANMDNDKWSELLGLYMSYMLPFDTFLKTKETIPAINGDVTIKVVSPKIYESRIYPMALYLSTNDNSVVELWTNNGLYKPYSTNMWVGDMISNIDYQHFKYLGIPIPQVYVGYDEKVSYITIDNPNPFSQPISTYDASRVAGKKLYASINPAPIVEAIKEDEKNYKYKRTNIFLSLFENVEYVELFSNQPLLEAELKLVMKDRTQNLIEYIIGEYVSKKLKL